MPQAKGNMFKGGHITRSDLFVPLVGELDVEDDEDSPALIELNGASSEDHVCIVDTSHHDHAFLGCQCFVCTGVLIHMSVFLLSRRTTLMCGGSSNRLRLAKTAACSPVVAY